MPSHDQRNSLPLPGIPPAMHEVTGYLVNVLAERLRNETAVALEGSGIRPRQIGLLLVLHDEKRAQQQQLGERLGMDRTTTMQLVCALEEDGLLVREADPADGRAYVLRLTARGERVAVRVDQQARTAASAVLAGLTRAECTQLHRLLRKALSAPS